MPRPQAVITNEALVEEARFILATLQRDDLFDEHVRLTEAERVLESSLSLPFADYQAFLNKFGYVRVDPLANSIEVTKGGARVAEVLDDAEFNARLARHFARELSGHTPSPSGGRAPVRADVAVSNLESLPPRPSRPSHPSTGPVAVPGPVDDVLDRRYRRGEVIGQGTIGTVYEGQHVGLGRALAIKEARGIFQYASFLRRDEVVRRIRTAVESQARLEHPNITQVLDQNTDREAPYFVFELAKGGSLRQRLAAAKDGKLPLEFAVRVLLQVAAALRYAHAEGTLHLGLKPENVLFDRFGNVKLADFGLTRVIERTEETASMPILVGGNSLGYMSPERLQPGVVDPVTGARPAPTAAADVYGLGLVFYEMIAGRLPGRRSPLPSEARPDIPEAFDDVFDRMTRDDPTERHASFDEVLEGFYQAFPSDLVFRPGVLPLWFEDPQPLSSRPQDQAGEPDGGGQAPEAKSLALAEASPVREEREPAVSMMQKPASAPPPR